MDIVIATKNGYKIREIRSLLKSFRDLELYSLINFSEYNPPKESGSTCSENAILKAVNAAMVLQKCVVADHGALFVPAIQGKSALMTSYAGPGATDKQNRQKLLYDMKDLRDLERVAYFECAIAIASPNGLEKVFVASCEGMIATEERGGSGFGYDSVFIKHDYNKTFGELEESVRMNISHRAKALKKMALFFQSCWKRESVKF